MTLKVEFKLKTYTYSTDPNSKPEETNICIITLELKVKILSMIKTHQNH